MEVREWSYEDFPEFTEEVEGARIIPTTGEEIGISYLHDVEYAEINGVKLHLQILQPVARNYEKIVCPCIVFIQGSAWMKQDVYGKLPMVAGLARRGYVVAIVEYRHSEIAPFPAQIMDARNAVRFMRKNAELYHVDPDHMILAGDSSGGHTAMFAGIISETMTIDSNTNITATLAEMTKEDRKENLYPGISADVRGIVNYYGSCSVVADDSNPSTINHCRADSPEGLVMGHVDFQDNPELKQKLSVECNITEDTAVPPTLIFHGTKDRTVNCEGSVILYRQLKKCGKDAQLYLIKGADHGGPEFWTEEALDIADHFIKDCLA